LSLRPNEGEKWTYSNWREKEEKWDMTPFPIRVEAESRSVEDSDSSAPFWLGFGTDKVRLVQWDHYGNG
jgi:hypothetical protein